MQSSIHHSVPALRQPGLFKTEVGVNSDLMGKAEIGQFIGRLHDFIQG